MSPEPLDVLRNLQDRVTALERQLGDPPGADSLQSNVLTQRPDGSIGALLTGGLQLLAATDPNVVPDDAQTVTWKRGDGVPAARIVGYGVPASVDSVIMIAYQAPDTGYAIARAGIVAADNSVVLARSIVDSDGASDYLQLATFQKLLIQVGVATVAVANDGGTGTTYPILLTSPWPVQHKVFAAGIYNTQTSATATRVLASQPGADLAHGRIDASSTVAQNVNFWWISLGR